MEIIAKPLYSLIPLEQFKLILGIDDREDKLSRFCLIAATHSIEQYCKRRLLRRKHFEKIEYNGDLLLPMREYPVVLLLSTQGVFTNGTIINGIVLGTIPDFTSNIDVPFLIELASIAKNYRALKYIQVTYRAGYTAGNVPPDLASACLELAAWNMSRYRSRRIGMTGSVRKDGEHLEMVMPQNVKALLEPYRRKTI